MSMGQQTGSVWSGMQVAVFGGLSVAYLATLHPSLPGGDAGELIVAADQLGVAHPPGYPLYTVLLKAFFITVPWGSVAWRANLLTSLFAAGAGAVLYQTLLMMTGSMASGLLTAGMFGFSRLTWEWSVTAEVFSLNNLLVAILLQAAVCFSQAKDARKAKVAVWGAVVSGLCLSNQHTSVVYVAVLVPWVLFSLHHAHVLSVGLCVRLCLGFLLGLLPYLYLPLSSLLADAAWTWGDQSSLPGFLTHLLRREYGTFSLLKGHTGQGLVQGLSAYMEHVAKDLTPSILFFFATTIFSLYQRRRGGGELLVLMLSMCVTYTVLFCWRANLDIHTPLLMTVVERFWMQSDLLLVAIAGVAYSDVMRIVNRLLPVLPLHLDTAMALTLVAMQLTLNYPVCDRSQDWAVEQFARDTLRAFPPGALVLTNGDLPSNSLRYFHISEHVRPDLTLFDQEVLTYDWSVRMLGRHARGLVWPGQRLYLMSGVDEQGRKLFTFRQFLGSNYNRKPIYACIGVQDHEPSWQAAYDLRPFGICQQFIKKGSKVKVDDWLKASAQFAVNWSYAVPAKQSTWEEVASAEMWRAKTVAADYILETVDSVHSSHQRLSLLPHAHQIYKVSMETNLHFPPYWHKNFALVCEKLRQVTTDDSEKLVLMKTSVAHFKAYLESEGSDPELASIRNHVQQLQAYLQSVGKSGGKKNR